VGKVYQHLSKVFVPSGFPFLESPPDLAEFSIKINEKFNEQLANILNEIETGMEFKFDEIISNMSVKDIHIAKDGSVMAIFHDVSSSCLSLYRINSRSSLKKVHKICCVKDAAEMHFAKSFDGNRLIIVTSDELKLYSYSDPLIGRTETDSSNLYFENGHTCMEQTACISIGRFKEVFHSASRGLLAATPSETHSKMLLMAFD
jgi:hypothetical protein